VGITPKNFFANIILKLNLEADRSERRVIEKHIPEKYFHQSKIIINTMILNSFSYTKNDSHI